MRRSKVNVMDETLEKWRRPGIVELDRETFEREAWRERGNYV
jgi:hypothetical protein